MPSVRLGRLVPGAAPQALALLEARRGSVEAPVRAEIFGAQRFAQHGRSLGKSHSAVGDHARATEFFPRLRDNIAVLREAHRYIGQQERTGQDVSPAGEWLLDNFHIVAAQLKEIHDGLPRRYFDDLPVLTGVHLAGLPRVYSVAWAFVAHTDSAFDEDLLVAFLDAYQQTRELTLGEMWALPTTLRVVLIENLRRLAELVAASKAARELGNQWCDNLADSPVADPQPLFDALELRGAGRAFALQVAQRLNHPTAEVMAPNGGRVRRWLARAVPDLAGTQAEQQAEQAANNLSVSNAITSLRLLGDTDWRALVERTSALMRAMQGSAAFCAERDDTQDTTLHAIERLARRCHASELSVAHALLAQMNAAPASGDLSAAARSPRYWLSGSGRLQLAQALGPRALPGWDWHALQHKVTLPAYLATLLLGSVGLTLWFTFHFTAHDGSGHWPLPWGVNLALTALLALGPASEAVIAFVNRLISESTRPRRLPRLALRDGIPPEHRVLVVVPALMGTVQGIESLALQLERHHLANLEANTQFALLTDLPDADAAHTDADPPLLAAAVAGVQALNARHPAAPGAPARFLLLHRGRRFSETEQRWIGWERKRGKLEQLIRWLAADAAAPAASPFTDLGAASQPVAGLPYIVTLDSDTQLPPGSLRELVGVAAHPLNLPRVDVARRRVTSGYGILQPRVATPLARSGDATPFNWLFAGQGGIDPYSAATSEIYQDLFGEGTFTGKGLLHVQALHAVLGGRLPEGAVLSHDLLEGSIARCGGVSDIVLIEDAPMHADVAASRLHRWTRGDWQLLPLLVRARHYGIGAINRWKMLDNLRRSLVAPTSLALLAASLAGWGAAPVGALLLVVAAFGAGPLLGAVAGLAPSRDDIALRHFYRQGLTDLARAACGTVWHVTQLLAHAALAVDAGARAVYRMTVSQRHLLQWTTAEAAQSAAGQRLRHILQQHWREPVAATALFAVLLVCGTPTPVLAGLLCLLWAVAPVFTGWASRPRGGPAQVRVLPADRDYLLDVARDTWRYFAHGVTAADHDLPPDNQQTFPYTMVAHRTSPTNIGLYLVATACAQRFGWIGTTELLERGERTLGALDGLVRHNGHFLNWYDTQTAQPLLPAYVSTVDSGNLCGCLIALAQACETLATAPLQPAGQAEVAVAASRRRLAAGAPALAALLPSDAARSALHDLLDVADPLARLRDDPAGLDTLLQRAASALPQWALDPSAQTAVVLPTAAPGNARSTEAGQAPSAPMLAAQCVRDYIDTLRSLAQDVAACAAHGEAALAQRLRTLAGHGRRLADEATFGFLYNGRRKLFHIGYRVAEAQLDTSYYDLLASESRLASLWAIAKGDVPVAHWAALGRPFFAIGGGAGLRSWSGSMFEYLMPALLLDEPDASVLGSASRAAVRSQQAFAEVRRVPWGISESAYAASDHTLAYQYAPQGVPTLALRRAPADELVVAPYATALAALIDPAAAVANLRRLEALHARGAAGFIEALDYTPERIATQAAFTPVYTFMAHHQGMTILALADVLLGAAPRRWAMAEPRLQAVASLLQERVPRQVSMVLEAPPGSSSADRRQAGPGLWRQVVPGTSALQPTHLLSNGRYSVALRANGAGWSRFGNAFISRWRDDALRDAHGMFFYIRRRVPAAPAPFGTRFRPAVVQTHAAPVFAAPVSITQHPAPDVGAHYEATFHIDRVCLDAKWSDLHTHCAVWVSPEDDLELRQIELRNLGGDEIELDLMSAFEVSMAEARADEAHPAFANLFVRAEWNAAERALYFERRPRLATEQGLHAVHFVAQADAQVLDVEVQADRARWLGRQRDASHPLAHYDTLPLAAPGADTAPADAATELVTGLDPMASLSLRVRLPAHGTVRFCIATAAARTRGELEALVDKYRQPSIIERSSTMSATLAGIRLREMRTSAANLAAIQIISTPLALLMARPAPLAAPDGVAIDRRVLWRFGISGDRPIVLVVAGAPHATGLVRTMVQALKLWTWGGLPCDLVLLNVEPASYLMPLQRELIAITERFKVETDASLPASRACALILLRAPELSASERGALEALARVQLNADGRPLAQHATELAEWHDAALDERIEHAVAVLAEPTQDADSWATQGDFSPDGARFRFDVSAETRPVRPWINVLANPEFGAQVSEAGAGYTWAGNSRMHQLTAWSNDAVTDPASELLLLQDLRTRKVWNTAPGAGAAATEYRVEHGQGITGIRHSPGDMEVQVTWCVDAARAVKQVRVTLSNRGSQVQRLRVMGIAEWMMGGGRIDRLSVATAHVPLGGADATQRLPLLTATQRDGVAGFGGATAFAVLLQEGVSASAANAASEWTCDRRELFDARGRLAVPDHFGERSGAGLDPCAALATTLLLKPGGTASCTWLIGHAASAEAAVALAREAVALAPAQRAQAVQAQWHELLGGVTVHTPDPLFDALVNRWLLYQTVACRLWGRAGFYQAGGAFGFRDQLQDAMALAVVAPAMLRNQLLLAASRQFPEGDVQHWWHAPTGAGVRTHFSDDLLWLGHAAVHYADTTGDTAVLDEMVPFLAGEPVPPGAEDAYYVAQAGDESATLYEHCARAIDHSLAVGVHGLPLMGSGDWNDGMNRVGIEGRGESVWLAWFLCRLAADFAPIAQRRGDTDRASRWLTAASGWRDALEGAAWDGAWYKRAFFDDGSALGSQHNAECRIDLIAQAWSVLSGAAPLARQREAMASVEQLLVDREAGLVRLLAPPLANAVPSAGYIQAYPPGVRENGGQYSHGGVWALMAHAALGQRDEAWRMFEMLSPAHRSASEERGPAYEIEPYVMAGDVYTQPPYVGRGGWSWYTGSAAWLYRAAIESIVGLQVRGTRVRVNPQIPSHWPGLQVTLRRAGVQHEFRVCSALDAAGIEESHALGAVLLTAGEWATLQAAPADADSAQTPAQRHYLVVLAPPGSAKGRASVDAAAALSLG